MKIPYHKKFVSDCGYCKDIKSACGVAKFGPESIQKRKVESIILIDNPKKEG